MLLLTLLFFASQTPLQSAALTPSGVRCSQATGMVLVEGICVSADQNVVVDGTLAPVQVRPLREQRKRPTPRVNLQCSPRMQIGGIRAVPVFASVRIMDPDEQYWCPQVSWNINGDSAGSQESDCKPFEKVIAEEGEPLVWPEGGETKKFWFGPGEYIITVKFIKSGRLIAKEQCTVQVR